MRKARPGKVLSRFNISPMCKCNPAFLMRYESELNRAPVRGFRIMRPVTSILRIV